MMTDNQREQFRMNLFKEVYLAAMSYHNSAKTARVAVEAFDEQFPSKELTKQNANYFLVEPKNNDD